MTTIKQDDLIDSVADALQFISYYHPVDFIHAIHDTYQREESPAARDAMAQILLLAHVRRGSSPDLPGHRYRYCIHEDRSEREVLRA